MRTHRRSKVPATPLTPSMPMLKLQTNFTNLDNLTLATNDDSRTALLRLDRIQPRPTAAATCLFRSIGLDSRFLGQLLNLLREEISTRSRLSRGVFVGASRRQYAHHVGGMRTTASVSMRRWTSGNRHVRRGGQGVSKRAISS